jgi:hypothetical protein
VARGFSPLDEELALLPGELTPSLVESLVRLGAWLPFTPAATLLGHFSQVAVSEATARRRTEQAGAAYVAVQAAEVERLEQERPAAPAGPAIQLLSVDGAMVPLVGGRWGEVKLLAIGTVGAPAWEDGEWRVEAEELSYFGRMTDAETFGRLATVETHRRGTETAGQVAAVLDGAEWQQGFVDLHRPDAVRILDFPHAAEYVAKAGQAGLGAATETTAQWLATQVHDLKHGQEQAVLDVLAGLRERAEQAGASDALTVIETSLGYLDKRREQLRYADFQAAGYPLGSGAVESGNKLVTQARLKGAGMHWAPEQVNPMVALRTLVCADRWDEGWEQISTRLRSAAHARTRARRATRRSAAAIVVDLPAAPTSATAPMPPGPSAPTPAPSATPATPPDQPAAPAHPSAAPTPRRPAANHPWRLMPIGRARSTKAAS